MEVLACLWPGQAYYSIKYLIRKNSPVDLYLFRHLCCYNVITFQFRVIFLLLCMLIVIDNVRKAIALSLVVTFPLVPWPAPKQIYNFQDNL